jgi:hypothetical protein
LPGTQPQESESQDERAQLQQNIQALTEKRNALLAQKGAS